MTAPIPEPRICAHCQEPTDGPLLPFDPSKPGSPLIAENHEPCNRFRLFAMLGRAAAISNARLTPASLISPVKVTP